MGKKSNEFIRTFDEQIELYVNGNKIKYAKEKNIIKHICGNCFHQINPFKTFKNYLALKR